MAATGAGDAGKKARTADGHFARFPDLDKIISRDSPFENSTGKLPMGKFQPGAKVGALGVVARHCRALAARSAAHARTRALCRLGRTWSVHASA